MRFTEFISEAGSPAQQAAIAIAMKKAGKKPKSVAEGSSNTDVKKQISKFEELALAANRAGDDAKCKQYQQKIQSLKQKMSQGVAEGAPELLKAEMPMVRHIENELATKGYKKGTEEYKKMFGHALAYYRKFGFPDYRKGVAEGSGGNWYIRVNGKILNDTKFKPVIFSSEDEARSHAMKLADKKRIPLSQMKLTKSWMDAPEQDMDEGENWSKHNNKRAGGMSKKSVASYRRSHPGSKIQTAVTTKPSKLKKGSKAAARRKSFCARMRGMKKHRTGAKTANDPNSNINKSLRRWHCESIEELHELVMLAEQYIRNNKK